MSIVVFVYVYIISYITEKYIHIFLLNFNPQLAVYFAIVHLSWFLLGVTQAGAGSTVTSLWLLCRHSSKTASVERHRSATGTH